MLRNITINTLRQLADVCQQIDQKDYCIPLQILSGSTIGQHVRHILEFYHCLAGQYAEGRIDYDLRVRNKAVENDPFMALEVLDSIIAYLNSCQSCDAIIKHTITYGDVELEASTSLDREFIYLIEHSIHHYAILQIAIKHALPDVILPTNFGYAYSTIKHQEAHKEALLHSHQHA